MDLFVDLKEVCLPDGLEDDVDGAQGARDPARADEVLVVPVAVVADPGARRYL